MWEAEQQIGRYLKARANILNVWQNLMVRILMKIRSCSFFFWSFHTFAGRIIAHIFVVWRRRHVCTYTVYIVLVCYSIVISNYVFILVYRLLSKHISYH